MERGWHRALWLAFLLGLTYVMAIGGLGIVAR